MSEWISPGFVDHHCHVLLEAGSKRVFIGQDPRSEHLSMADRRSSPADEPFGEPLDAQEMKNSILNGLQRAALAGLVEITEPGLDCWEQFEAVVGLRAASQLPLRVNVLVRSGLAEQATAKGIITRKTHDPAIDVTGVKFYIDGWLGAQTCAVSEPFVNSDHNGILFMDAQTLARRAAPFAEQDLQIVTHAIGDRAIETVLDAYEMIFENPRECSNANPRIEHAQILRQDLVERIAEWGVTICAQPAFGASDYKLLREVLPSQFTELSYNWQHLIDHGVRVIFGSDYAIAELSPLLGLQHLATGVLDKTSRKQSAPTVELNAAISRMTDKAKGSTTLATNAYDVDPFELSEIKVLSTAPIYY